MWPLLFAACFCVAVLAMMRSMVQTVHAARAGLGVPAEHAPPPLSPGPRVVVVPDEAELDKRDDDSPPSYVSVTRGTAY